MRRLKHPISLLAAALLLLAQTGSGLMQSVATAASAPITVDGVTETTPTQPGATACGSTTTTFDTISITGLKPGQQANGDYTVYYVQPNNGGMTVAREDTLPQSAPSTVYPNPVSFSVVGTSQVTGYTAEVFYPPSVEWPVTNTSTNQQQVHVRVSLSVFDPSTGTSYDFGTGQDWDVMCTAGSTTAAATTPVATTPGATTPVATTPGATTPSATTTPPATSSSTSASATATPAPSAGTPAATTQGVTLAPGMTGTIGFWNSNNGQTLITSMNGSSTANNMPNWLANNFPNLYGQNCGPSDTVNQTNQFVALLAQQYFNQTGQNMNGEVLDTAIAVYATNSSLSGGTAATTYGFTVNTTGTGAATYNVSNYGDALNVSNNSVLTIMQMLQDENTEANSSCIFNGNNSNDQGSTEHLFRLINEAGNGSSTH